MQAQSGLLQKLHLDFARPGGMSEVVAGTEPVSESHRLIALLLLEAGQIMEDACPDLALRLPQSRQAIDRRLADARQVGDDVSTLMAAAQVLQRRCGDN